jgi:hypothetical protein
MRHRREEPALRLCCIVLALAERTIQFRGVRHDGVFYASIETGKQRTRGMAKDDLQAKCEHGVRDGFASFESGDNALRRSQEEREF